jgi:hypothetical protein
MRRISGEFRFRSLTISVLALLLVPFTAGILDWPSNGSRTFLLGEAAVSLFGISVCIAGYANLIRDERAGYPSSRVSLAAMLLLIALAPHALLAVMVIHDLLTK